MSSALRRRTVYIGTVVAILALSAGFVLASGVTLTHTTQNAMGNGTSGAGDVVGITYVSTELNVSNANTIQVSSGANALGKPAAPVALVASPAINAFCLSSIASPAASCVNGNFAEVVNYSFSTSFAGAAEFTMYVAYGSSSPGSNIGFASLFVKQATTPVTGTILLYWDLGSSSTNVYSVTVTVYQCTGAGSTCP
jgi:hypothetical protein